MPFPMVWVPFSRSGCCPQELSAFPRICEFSPGAGTTSSATKRRVFINPAFKFPAGAISNHSRDILYLLQGIVSVFSQRLQAQIKPQLIRGNLDIFYSLFVLWRFNWASKEIHLRSVSFD